MIALAASPGVRPSLVRRIRGQAVYHCNRAIQELKARDQARQLAGTEPRSRCQPISGPNNACWAAFVPCPWDCGDFDGIVGIVDFLAILAQWGQVGTQCDMGFGAPAVGIDEFLGLLANWGPCIP